MLVMLRDCTSESMNPRPCFQELRHHFYSLLLLATLLFLFIQIKKPISIIHTTHLSSSLRQTSAHMLLTIVLAVLGTQETTSI